MRSPCDYGAERGLSPITSSPMASQWITIVQRVAVLQCPPPLAYHESRIDCHTQVYYNMLHGKKETDE